jgi:hypothetical protein
VTDWPGGGPHPDPFADPLGEPAPGPTARPTTDPTPPSGESPSPPPAQDDPAFDPEKTTGISETPTARPAPPPDPSWDPERTTELTPTPPPMLSPPPVFTSNQRPSGPAAAPPPIYGPPPVFTAHQIPSQPRNDRRRWLIAIIAACVVVAVVLVVVIVAVSRGGSGNPGTPQDAAKAYLEALSRGDAEAALALGQDQPGSKELLTNDVLKKQIARMPITDIKILGNGSPIGDYARVHVSARFSSQVSDTQLSMRKSGDGWKLVNAAIKLDYGDFRRTNQAIGALTVFDEATTDPVYVFPGWVEYGSSNPNLVFDAPAPLLDQLEMFMQFASVQVKLSDEAQKTILSDLSGDLAACTASNRLAPPGCPLKVEPTNLIDGTARWGPINDLSQILTTFNPYTMSVAINGTVRTTFMAQTRSGVPTNGNLTGIISGTADLTKNPPTISYR